MNPAFDQLARLQRLTAELASAVEPARIAEVVVDHLVGAIGADTAAMWRVDDDRLVMMRSLGFSPEAVAGASSVPLAADAPVCRALADAAPLLLSDREEYARRFPAYEAEARGFRMTCGAVVCLPLVIGRLRLGAISYTFDAPRAFDAHDRTYFDLIAAHAAQALERARLFEAERAARVRVEVLYELAAAAARALTVEDLFEPALDAVCCSLAVDRASVLLFDATGTMRFRAWRGLSDEYRAAVDGHSPWTRDAVDPQPILVGDVEKDPSLAAYVDVFREESIRALAFVPLVHDRRLIGKFMLYGRDVRVFTADDVRLASAIATPLAQAIARRTAEEETRRARAAAEQAAHARAEMVAVVAHDLRNPLGVAQLKAQMMMRRLPESGAEQAKKDLDTIIRSAQQMARLIGDLLDASAVDSGRIALERADHDLPDVVNEAAELARPLAEQRGLRLAVDVERANVVVSCDKSRVLQVLSNLLGNAIKFTPAGGEVRVVVRRAGGAPPAIAVEDTGPGIPEEERERVFLRYVHGRQRGSLGLGLYIARGFVAAHGGRIWIEHASPSGGTRVCFTLAEA